MFKSITKFDEVGFEIWHANITSSAHLIVTLTAPQIHENIYVCTLKLLHAPV